MLSVFSISHLYSHRCRLSSLIFSLLLCMSCAILRCSSTLFALWRASSSAAATHIGLSDLEYSLSLLTKLSKSCCFCSLFSNDLFWSSGLYFCSMLAHTLRVQPSQPTCLEQFFFGRRYPVDKGGASNAQYETTRNVQMTSTIMRAIRLCSYVDSILNHSAAFDMMASEAADVDPCISGQT